MGKVSKRREQSEAQKPETFNDTDCFKDKLVAFTGPLQSMARHEAIGIIEKLGGNYTPSVTLKTNLVITNVKNPMTLDPDQMSTKLRRAMTLIGRGQKIDFMNEEEFLKLVKTSSK
ncbi:BRCT domain-containing protein [Cellulosilyticum ruminicola]|uniref:BRCT domain-containing protein n=1 Tax=Cellulosilyticum ruminicola TaxID=425254 RepID=UPI002E8E56F7|nr:BRCT domain-containing protein [Cellulosilyticum ruminicola]